MGTITLQVQLDTHDPEDGGSEVDPEKLAMAVYRALDFALDGEIENTECLNYHDIGQISVSVVHPDATDGDERGLHGMFYGGAGACPACGQ